MKNLLPTLLVVGLASFAQPINYTINAAQPTTGNNFASFGDLATHLNTLTLTSAIQVNVVAGSGPYTEQFILGELTGAGAANAIAIHGNGETIQFTSATSTQRATIKLDGTDYISIDNLVIKALGQPGSPTQYGFGIHLLNNADHVSITNCSISVDKTSTSTTAFGGIVGNSSNTLTTSSASVSANYLLIENCVIEGGFYGIMLNGLSATPAAGNAVKNCLVKDSYSNGIRYNNSVSSSIEGCAVFRPGRASSGTFYGINVLGQANGVEILGNKIHNIADNIGTAQFAVYGIGLSSASTSNTSQPLIIANNACFALNGQGQTTGIYATSTDNFRIWHNTIVLDNSGLNSDDVSGIYITGSPIDVDIRNNNIYLNHATTSANYFGIRLAQISAINCDYNNVYRANLSAKYGRRGTSSQTYTTLADWQLATGFDGNGAEINPQFINLATGNLKPTNAAFDNLGLPIASFLIDIDGTLRSLTTPDIGAWEFSTTPITWYLDADFDGRYVQTQLSVSSPGTGWNTTGGTPGDCDDSNVNVWQSANLYVDADGDGYDAGNSVVCYGNAVPQGYALATNGADCNDNDINVWIATVWYKDGDADNWFISQLSCNSPGPAWSNTISPTQLGDCNDGNNAIHPGATEICGNGIDEDCVGGDLPCGGGNCNATVTLTPSGLKTFWGPDASDAYTFYHGVTQWKDITAKVIGGSGSYSYAWSMAGLVAMVPRSAANRVAMFEATGPVSVSVTVTDLVTNCTYTQSIAIAWSNQFYCGTPQNYWQILVCASGVTSCELWNVAKTKIIGGTATLGACTSKTDYALDNKLTMEVFPNPNNGRFTVTAHSATAQTKLEIYNHTAKRLFVLDVNPVNGQLQHTFDLSHLPNGLYFIQVNDGKTVLTEKVVISH